MTDDGYAMPDGFILVHQPKDGSERYGIGPFPPIDDLADMLLRDTACDCDRTVLWVKFPKGIVLGMAIPDEVVAKVHADTAEKPH